MFSNDLLQLGLALSVREALVSLLYYAHPKLMTGDSCWREKNVSFNAAYSKNIHDGLVLSFR